MINLESINRGNIELYRKDNFEVIKKQIEERLSVHNQDVDVTDLTIKITNAFEGLHRKLSDVESNIVNSISDLVNQLDILKQKIEEGVFNEQKLEDLNKELVQQINQNLSDLPEEITEQWKKIQASSQKEIADVKSKFKLSIPIVPGILKHETELTKDLPIFKWARQYWSGFKLDSPNK